MVTPAHISDTKVGGTQLVSSEEVKLYRSATINNAQQKIYKKQRKEWCRGEVTSVWQHFPLLLHTYLTSQNLLDTNKIAMTFFPPLHD